MNMMFSGFNSNDQDGIFDELKSNTITWLNMNKVLTKIKPTVNKYMIHLLLTKYWSRSCYIIVNWCCITTTDRHTTSYKNPSIHMLFFCVGYFWVEPLELPVPVSWGTAVCSRAGNSTSPRLDHWTNKQKSLSKHCNLQKLRVLLLIIIILIEENKSRKIR